MAQQGKLPEDSMERMMEQGAGQDPQNSPLAQMKASALRQAQGDKTGGGSKSSNPLDMVTGLVDPNAWVRQLYGVPEPVGGGSDKDQMEKLKNKSNHTPLDKSKVGSKEITPDQRRFFKKYQVEYEQFLDQKKKQAQDKKRQEEDEERRKMEEEKKRREQEEGQGEAQGKQKQKLGQPRRKATTELHPETKAGGAK